MVLPQDNEHFRRKDNLKHDYREWIRAARKQAGQVVDSATAESQGNSNKLQYLLAEKAVKLEAAITGRVTTVQKDTDLQEVRSFKDWKKYFYPERINNFVARATCPDDIEAHDPLIKVVEELVTTPPANLQTEFTDFHSLFTAFFEMKASRKPSARKKTSTTHSAFISQEVNYHELGLESWAFAGKVPPYVSREQDAKLDEFLSNTAPGEQLIVISGPAKSGKTRSVVEALKRIRPRSEVIWARRDKGLSTLPSELNTALKRIDGPQPDGYFVVIDDLQLYGLGSPHGFTSELLTKLNKNASIIVTVHSSALKQWKLEIQQHKATSQIPSIGPSPYIVNLLDEHELRYDARLTDGELDDAIEVWAKESDDRDPDDAPDELRYWPEYLSATDLLISKIELAEESDGYKKAFIHALVDAFHLYPFGATEEQLKYLTRFHYRTISPINASRENRMNRDFETAMDWAAEPVGGGGSTSAILDVFFDEEELDIDDGMDAFDREITYAITPSLPTRLYAASWDPKHLEPERDSHVLTDDACFYCGNAAYRLKDESSAIAWWKAAVDKGSIAALNNLGIVSHESGKVDKALDYLEEAASAGDATALTLLGTIYHGYGNFDQAFEYFNQAAELGDIDAVAFLGTIALQDQNLDAAQALFETAADQGSPIAYWGLGALYLAKKDLETAYHWYTKAALNDNSESYVALSLIETEWNHLESAQELLKKAIEIDNNPVALNNLGVLLYKQWSPYFNPEMFTKAFENGCMNAMWNILGIRSLDESTDLEKVFFELSQYMADNPLLFGETAPMSLITQSLFTQLTEEARQLQTGFIVEAFEAAADGDEDAAAVAQMMEDTARFVYRDQAEEVFEKLGVEPLDEHTISSQTIRALLEHNETPQD